MKPGWVGSASACALALALAAAAMPRPAAAVTVPAGFAVEDAVPGANFLVPTAIAFIPGGRLLVAEKRGRVYVVKNGIKNPAPMWQRENEVLDESDRGLLDVAVDPNYPSNHYIYLLYTVDPDSDGVDNDDEAFGRLTRYTVSATDSNVVDYSTRTILLGVDWRHGPLEATPSHTVGAMRWGADGSLLVSIGDGAGFDNTDAGGEDPNGFGPGKSDPYEDIGAYRSQYIGFLPGKLLRLNPATGLAYPSNPYWNGDATAPRSKVWAYGLRNPFRFAVKPGTGNPNPANGAPGTIYIGDVGWVTWEEVNIAKTPGQNFGWPCYEGIDEQFHYQVASPSHGGCDSIGTAWNPAAVTPPTATWHHYNPVLGTPPGFIGNCSIGGVFYTGSFYPAGYQNRYFFGDFAQSWIKILVADSNDNLIDVQSFADSADSPVDFALDPVSKDIYYVSISTFEVRRIRWLGGVSGNTAPVAEANGTPTFGQPPLTVNFSSAGSYDLDNDSLTTTWLFGDAQGSTDPNPTHTYTIAGVYSAILTVEDGNGGLGRDTVIVNVPAPLGFPSAGILDNFNRANGAIGGAWVDDTGALEINNNALILNGTSATTVWSAAVFDSVQEAYFTLDAVTPTISEHDLMLKVQGLSWAAGHIEVRYNVLSSEVTVSTYDPEAGWIERGVIPSVTLQAGDQYGARAYDDGNVEVYRNGTLQGTVSVGDWPFAAMGGRVGMTLSNANDSRIDNFGGGTSVPVINTRPTAAIQSPADTAFYITGQEITLRGSGSDAQDAPGALGYHWSVRLHHNTHQHNTLEADGDSTGFFAVDDDDGTGVFFEIRLYVTDLGGLKDTAIVNIFPEADLEPSAVTVIPGVPVTTGSAKYQFRLLNHGRLPAHISNWRLVANATTLAQGDTVVPALDSVIIVRILPPTLPAGNYDLRVVADSGRTVVETDETNNAKTRPLTVIEGPTGVADAPLRLVLSKPFPNPSMGAVSLALELPRPSRVEVAVFDLNGREVHREPEHELPAGRWALRWSGRLPDGRVARPGIYLARVTVDGQPFLRRLALVR